MLLKGSELNFQVYRPPVIQPLQLRIKPPRVTIELRLRIQPPRVSIKESTRKRILSPAIISVYFYQVSSSSLGLDPKMPQALTIQATSSEADKALHLRQSELLPLEEHHVLVKFLAMPVNHLDLLMIGGKYPLKPRNHIQGEAIAGNDGIGRVIQCGDQVSELKPGDLVIPNELGLGTWRSHAIFQPSSLLQIPPLINLTLGALMRCCILPAYLLLEDMSNLRPGDWIIQNGGTGVIAQMVAQLAHLRGVRVISVIRDRPEKPSSLYYADLVLEEREVPRSDHLKGKRIMLGLDSVFGLSAEKVADCLSDHGTFVNYGQLGGGGPSAAMNLTHSHIFWKQLTFKSFRGTKQSSQRTAAELQGLCRWFAHLINAGLLHTPDIETVQWIEGERQTAANLLNAIARTQSGMIGTRKLLFTFPTQEKLA